MPPTLDRWQYRLSPQRGTDAYPVGDRWLEVGPGLPCMRITDARGQYLGLLLGFPIDLAARRIVEGDWQVEAILESGDPGKAAEAVVRALGGPFLFILDAGGVQRVYPNTNGSIPCVHDDETGLTGSTAAALLERTEYDARFNRKLYDDLGVDGEGWFPAGLTAHRGIRRLLAGHYLDLRDGSMTRFWLRDPVARCTDTDALVEEVITLVQAQLEALLAGPKRVAMALTAGRETRMLLACAQPWRSQVDVMTIVAKDDRHATDSEIAGRIARDMGLNHLTLPRVTATREQREKFIFRGGHCNADTNSHYHPSTWPLAETHVFVGGVGGEVGRAFLWRSHDRPDTPITPQLLIRRLGLPEVPELAKALDAWLEEISPDDAFHILDLAYHENRVSSWGSVQFSCDPKLVRYAPLMTMRGVELMMSLPPDWKRSSRLGPEMIGKAWPELGHYPYNTLGPFRDSYIKFLRVLRDPRVVLKKIRKIRG